MNDYWNNAILKIELLNAAEKKKYERSIRPAPTTVEQAVDFSIEDINVLMDDCLDPVYVDDWPEFRQILERLVLECHDLFQQENKT